MSFNDVFFVLTNPVPGREKKYNDWYSDTHVPDLMATPGVAAGQRFRIEAAPDGTPDKRQYLAIYEFSSTREAIEGIASRRGTPAMVLCDALDGNMTLTHVMTPTGPVFSEAVGGAGAILLCLVSGAWTPVGLEAAVAKMHPLVPQGGWGLATQSALQRRPGPHPDHVLVFTFSSKVALMGAWPRVQESLRLVAAAGATVELLCATPITKRLTSVLKAA